MLKARPHDTQYFTAAKVTRPHDTQYFTVFGLDPAAARHSHVGRVARATRPTVRPQSNGAAKANGQGCCQSQMVEDRVPKVIFSMISQIKMVKDVT